MPSIPAKQITKDMLNTLSDRSRKVLSGRFGLASDGVRRTLDAIGKEYNITRERIRQIENHALALVRESDVYEMHIPSLDALKRLLIDRGSVVSEELFLRELGKNDAERNHFAFLLTVGHQFENRREDNDFHSRWHTSEQITGQVERALSALYKSLDIDNLISEDEFIQRFADFLKQEGVKSRPEESVLTHWLSFSKRIGKNPLGEWGRVDSPHVRIKNTRDFAYLAIKRHGSPMHFTEVAKNITALFNRDAHPATTHNELIKDKRFVLVGRGLYALKEWGYASGIVRDVIVGILKREGPLSRSEIVDRVKRERYVKDATITVNLQNNLFTRTPVGKWDLRANNV